MGHAKCFVFQGHLYRSPSLSANKPTNKPLENRANKNANGFVYFASGARKTYRQRFHARFIPPSANLQVMI
jgi:hypothetical protein